MVKLSVHLSQNYNRGTAFWIALYIGKSYALIKGLATEMKQWKPDSGCIGDTEFGSLVSS